MDCELVISMLLDVMQYPVIVVHSPLIALNDQYVEIT